MTDKADREFKKQQFTEVHYGKGKDPAQTVMRSLKQTKLNYWLATPALPTSNSFTGLDDIEQEDVSEIQVPKPIRPPPIFIDSVRNIQP